MPAGARGFAVFFTGLPAAGKSTLAETVRGVLQAELDQPVHLLDGDVLRRELSSDLGYSRADREEHVRRVASRSAGLVRAGGVVLCSLIAPYGSARAAARRTVEPCGAFVLVHVSTPLRVCEARDPKGLYARARSGALPCFTGVSDPYEPPSDAEVTIDTSVMSPEQAGLRVADDLRARGLIAPRAPSSPT
jgi:sulfate adenylyltransferase